MYKNWIFIKQIWLIFDISLYIFTINYVIREERIVYYKRLIFEVVKYMLAPSLAGTTKCSDFVT